MARRAKWAAAVLAAAGAATALAGGALMLDAAYPPAMERYLEPSRSVLDSEGRLLRAFITNDGRWRFSVRPEEVDPRYLAMLTAYEDKRFFRHPGVDPLALARAAWQWVASGKPISGASTLTMQTVRLLEPRPRTLASKLVEMLRAMQLEWHHSKNEILSIYLTVAPFGGNLEGVTAATRFYLGKEPRYLTAGEAALLVALPQSPEANRPDRHPGLARLARDKVLARVGQAGVLDAAAVAAARREAVPKVRLAAAFRAPHLAERLAAVDPGAEIRRSFIDGGLQASLEDLARRAAHVLEPGANLAIMVVETAGRRVVGHIGSADFFDADRRGQVDMTRAVRSPGSTLKPFVYAAAFEVLGLHPETIVADRPMRFGDYAPINFDRRYRGDVTVREALQLSLNVPAVAVLDRLGPARFAGMVADMGGTLRFDPRIGGAGLPMALGGVGLSLWDLVTLYAGLADGGRFAPLRVAEADPQADPVRLLDEVAAWYVADILGDVPPPQGRVTAARRIAVKTGTSYGFRDAWALGFDGRFTVGVWVGRPDGGYGADRTGGRQAAPLLHDVFDLLPSGAPPVAAPPAGAVLARTDELPPSLRRFRTREQMDAAPFAPESAFEIAFPPDGATVETAADGDGKAPLSLRASGGRKPISWLIDGRPIAVSPFKREVLWTAAAEGQVRITALDADGHAASAQVWISHAP
ncbi:MAG: penicillin-binding protein 1C [Rhodospirillales bacterium]|jgi:penicillin-binding protein 1C|nr:penicillin-binding protein 1C [Rhodospirillales bacterium]